MHFLSCGWRPLVGWVCVCGLAIQFVGAPILQIVLPLLGYPDIKVPMLDMGPLVSLILGVIGMAGVRTIEKLNGVQDTH